MDVVKCIFAGVTFLIATAFLLLVIWMVAVSASAPAEAGEAIAIDPISVVKSSPTLWVIGVAAFSLGFYWEHRRLKKVHHRK